MLNLKHHVLCCFWHKSCFKNGPCNSYKNEGSISYIMDVDICSHNTVNGWRSRFDGHPTHSTSRVGQLSRTHIKCYPLFWAVAKHTPSNKLVAPINPI